MKIFFHQYLLPLDIRDVCAVRSVVEPLFALLCVLRLVAASRGMRRQRSTEQAGRQAGHCRAQEECLEPQGVRDQGHTDIDTN